MGIKEVSEENLLAVYTVMHELRPHISEKDFVSIYHQARKSDHYTLYAFYHEQNCVGLMGLRYLHDYVHQFHLYIDDLVVKSEFRSQGVGARLLKFAEELAKEKFCTGIRLCTGIDNKEGMRFYERENWASRAVVYKKKL